MTTGTYATDKDYQKVSNGQHGDTIPTVQLSGGLYGIVVHAGTWGGGNLDFQTLAADGSTYVTVLPAVFTADGYKNVALPGGVYQFKITTTDGIYATVSRIARGSAA